MTRKYYVYLHAKPSGDIFYVGKGYGKRCKEFKWGRNLHHRHITDRYGKENIKVFVFPCNSNDEAIATEIEWIKQLRADGISLVNVTAGGEGSLGRVISDESRKRLSAAHVKNRALYSARMMGNKYFEGRSHTEETKQKMSAWQTGRKLSETHCKNISIAKKGQQSRLGAKLSDETKRKISESLKKRHQK